MSMDTRSTTTEYRRPLRFFFFSYPAIGHMIPLIDIAKLFSRRPGVSCTFVATPGNEYVVRPAIEGSSVNLLLLPFPPEAAAALGSGVGENATTVPRSQLGRLLSALRALKDPFHDLLRAHRADCVVSDVDSSTMWIDDVALALGIPRILFVIVGVFPATVVETVATLPGAHDESVETLTIEEEEGIDLPKAELSTFLSNPEIIRAIQEAKRSCFWVVFNTFYDLEGRYVERYRTNPGSPRRTFCVGPVFLSMTAAASAANRGGKMDSAGEECLKWLDSVEAEGSVTYVCFGTQNELGREQLTSIALGLEASGYPFVWVVKSLAEDIAGWLPEGFEEKMEGRGLIIKGWAPQVAILSHQAVGAIVMHCGWNSTLEGISAGLPLVTWPLQFEQFATEKFVTQVLRVGVSACRGARLAEAVREVMGSRGAEMRQRVREYAAKAKEAVQEGGSSYKDVDNLIEEVGNYHAAGKQG